VPVAVAGDVAALGDGKVGSTTRTFTVNVGDTVLYSKFGIGATDLEVDGKDFVLIREDDLIGVLPHSNATAADVPELKPLNDRVLIKVSILMQCRHGCRGFQPQRGAMLTRCRNR
jgi:chaperonin GroES